MVFRIHDKEFKNKTIAKAFMKERFQQLPENPEGTKDPYFIYLFENYHYGIKNNYKVEKIRSLNKRMEVYVDGIGWHGASYIKCFHPPTFQSEVKSALRLHFDETIKPTYEENKPSKCEYCERRQPAILHHEKPEFAEIIEPILKKYTEEEKQDWLGHKWEEKENFRIPEGHETLEMLVKEHKKALLRWVCKKCHDQTLSEEGKKTLYDKLYNMPQQQELF